MSHYPPRPRRTTGSPASPIELQYLTDREIQDLVAKAHEKAGRTVRRQRHTRPINEE